MLKYTAYLMNPSDILLSRNVRSLSALEELWYRRALDIGWLEEGMPADPTEFADAVQRGCTPEAAAKIIRLFYTPHKRKSAVVINSRQENERKKLKKKIFKCSNAGKESGRKRRAAKNLDAERTFNVRSADVEQLKEKKRKEIKENEIKRETLSASAPPKRKASRIPDPFELTTEMKQYAFLRRPDVDVAVEHERFINYWTAKAGKDACKLDWLATWRNWILGATTNGRHRGNAKGPDMQVGKQDAKEDYDLLISPCEKCGDEICLGGQACADRTKGKTK